MNKRLVKTILGAEKASIASLRSAKRMPPLPG